MIRLISFHHAEPPTASFTLLPDQPNGSLPPEPPERSLSPRSPSSHNFPPVSGCHVPNAPSHPQTRTLARTPPSPSRLPPRAVLPCLRRCRSRIQSPSRPDRDGTYPPQSHGLRQCRTPHPSSG